ncbi:Hypothetical predicted protein [Cloeon dipterum]|uniref:Uncharacterized protein n=1 Tax=Cloeon dipterum TaxID=197152 RepID=A0A8S1D9D2_9INSE|nr:Hypothetical predicted protein [Cloeon dipterum]
MRCSAAMSNTTPGYLLVKKINWLFSNSEKCLMANIKVLHVDANMTAVWEEQQLSTPCFRRRTALGAATTVVVVLRDEDQRDRAEAEKLLVNAKEANNLLSLPSTSFFAILACPVFSSKEPLMWH